MPKNVAPDATLEAFGTQAYSSSFTPDISSVNTVKLTLTSGPTTINAPTGRIFGTYTLVFVQDATGGRLVGWNGTDYPDFSANGWNPNQAANSVSSISFYYDSNSGKWRPYSTFNGDLWGFRSSSTGSNNNLVRIANRSITGDSTGLTFSGTGNFSGTVTGSDPTASTHLATKNYVDNNFLGVITNITSNVTTSGTSAFALLTATVPANSVAIGDTFRVSISGVTAALGNPTWSVAVGASSPGTTQLWTTAALTGAAAAGGGMEVYVTVKSVGSSGTVVGSGFGRINTAIGSSSSSATQTVNTTANWFITARVAMSASTFTAMSGAVELIK